MSSRLRLLLLLAVCGMLYLPGGNTTPLYTRGEAREALAVREVVDTGAWVVPMRPGGQLTKKPPLFYWAGMLAAHVLPRSPEMAARLPSIVAGTIGVLAIGWAGADVAGASAPLAAIMLATSFEWLRAASTARVDMVLVGSLTLVLLGAALRLGGRETIGTTAALAAGTALAILAKGPIGVAFPATALLVTSVATRDVRVLRLLVPLAAGTVVAALWYVVAWRAHGQAFLDVVLAENLGRFVNTEKARTGHAHGAPYLLAAFALGFLPWTPLLPAAVTTGEARPAVRTFLLAWIATIAVVVLASSSKRPVYLLPIFPALALLVADGLTAPPSPRLTRALRRSTIFYPPALAVVAGAFVIVAAGVPLARLLGAALPPEDLTALALVQGSSSARLGLGGAAIASAVSAVLVARARAAGTWHRLVMAVTAALVVVTMAVQTWIHPAFGRARGFADFLPPLARIVPPDEPLYAYLPIDPGVRYYAPRPILSWKDRPADRDVYLLAWEQQVAALPDAAEPMLDRLAVSENGHGNRGRLVLVRVPRGVLPPRRNAAVP